MEKEAVTLLKNLLMQQNRKTVTLDALQEVCRRPASALLLTRLSTITTSMPCSSSSTHVWLPM